MYAGKVEVVEIFDFLLHSHLRVELNPYINLVVGRNGGGKSAIAAALCFGFGLEGRKCGRNMRLADYIRRPKKFEKNPPDKTCVILTISNSGPHSLSQYASPILIKRLLTNSGLSSYFQGERIAHKTAQKTQVARKNQEQIAQKNDKNMTEKTAEKTNDKNAATKNRGEKKNTEKYDIIWKKINKKEMERIRDELNIRLEDSVVYLSQQEAKHLLATSDPADLYTFYFSALGHDEAEQNVNAEDENVAIAEEQISIFRAEATRLKIHIVDLGKQLAVWGELEEKKKKIFFLRAQVALTKYRAALAQVRAKKTCRKKIEDEKAREKQLLMQLDKLRGIIQNLQKRQNPPQNNNQILHLKANIQFQDTQIHTLHSQIHSLREICQKTERENPNEELELLEEQKINISQKIEQIDHQMALSHDKRKQDYQRICAARETLEKNQMNFEKNQINIEKNHMNIEKNCINIETNHMNIEKNSNYEQAIFNHTTNPRDRLHNLMVEKARGEAERLCAGGVLGPVGDFLFFVDKEEGDIEEKRANVAEKGADLAEKGADFRKKSLARKIDILERHVFERCGTWLVERRTDKALVEEILTKYKIGGNFDNPRRLAIPRICMVQNLKREIYPQLEKIKKSELFTSLYNLLDRRETPAAVLNFLVDDLKIERCIIAHNLKILQHIIEDRQIHHVNSGYELQKGVRMERTQSAWRIPYAPLLLPRLGYIRSAGQNNNTEKYLENHEKNAEKYQENHQKEFHENHKKKAAKFRENHEQNGAIRQEFEEERLHIEKLEVELKESDAAERLRREKLLKAREAEKTAQFEVSKKIRLLSAQIYASQHIEDKEEEREDGEVVRIEENIKKRIAEAEKTKHIHQTELENILQNVKLAEEDSASLLQEIEEDKKKCAIIEQQLTSFGNLDAQITIIEEEEKNAINLASEIRVTLSPHLLQSFEGGDKNPRKKAKTSHCDPESSRNSEIANFNPESNIDCAISHCNPESSRNSEITIFNPESKNDLELLREVERSVDEMVLPLRGAMDLKIDLDRRKKEILNVEKKLLNYEETFAVLSVNGKRRGRDFRCHVTETGGKLMDLFESNVKMGRFSGHMELDHPRRRLSLVVSHKEGERNTHSLLSLSGGEKSTFQIGFICALAALVHSPIHIFDELDVYMDDLVRFQNMTHIINFALSKSNSQFILLTPHCEIAQNLRLKLPPHKLAIFNISST